MKNPARCLLACSILVTFAVGRVFGQVNVLTYHNDNNRDGLNSNETLLTPANVNTNTFEKLFSYSVDSYVYAQPLYVAGLNIPGQGTHNVIFIATAHNSVYAFDADNNTGPDGGLLWQTNLGPAEPTPTTNFGTRYGGLYGDVLPEVGIVGTPVIDPASGTLYVDAFTHEGTNFYHRLHALNITNGMERPNSPVLIAASVPGSGVGSVSGQVIFVAKQQIQRCALTLAGGIVYLCYAGYADTDPYHGWVIGFDADSLQPLTNYVFNTTPNSTVAAWGANAGEGGIWMAGGGLLVDTSTNLYFEVGNGIFDDTTEFGDSFIRLSTTNGLALVDYFTPYNQQTLQNQDKDLGSGGLLLLPDQPGTYPHLLVGAGKEGKIYLINRDMFTTGNHHYDSTGTVDFVVQTVAGQMNGSFDTPAYYQGWIYYAANSDRLKAFALNNGLLSTAPVATGTRTYGFPGATVSVSANVTNNGIVWALQNANPSVLVAYDATNLSREIYNSSQAGTRDRLANGVKFAVPTVANGKVYTGNQYSVSVFGLLPFVNWQFACFGANATNASIAGDIADPDADGAVNLLEYALATDPTTPNGSESLLGAMVGSQFQLHFRRNPSASDVTYAVQYAAAVGGPWNDLMTYTAATGWVANTAGASAAESVTFGVPPAQYVEVTVTDPADLNSTGATNRFYRLAVHR